MEKPESKKNEPDIVLPPEESFQYVLRKKKDTHAGHGGAWKVAYADFVTALMAMFIVLWLTGQSSHTKAAIGKYFTEPGSYKGTSNQVEQIEARTFAQGSKQSLKNVYKNMDASKMDMIETLQEFENIDSSALVEITADGIEIELAESDNNVYFEPGSAKITKEARDRIFSVFARMKKIKNPIIIEGHTDGTSADNRPEYTNWELSGDRANVFRKLVEESGVGTVIEVRAFGDSDLIRTDQPEHPSNRRVNFIIKNLD